MHCIYKACAESYVHVVKKSYTLVSNFYKCIFDNFLCRVNGWRYRATTRTFSFRWWFPDKVLAWSRCTPCYRTRSTSCLGFYSGRNLPSEGSSSSTWTFQLSRVLSQFAEKLVSRMLAVLSLNLRQGLWSPEGCLGRLSLPFLPSPPFQAPSIGIKNNLNEDIAINSRF